MAPATGGADTRAWVKVFDFLTPPPNGRATQTGNLMECFESTVRLTRGQQAYNATATLFVQLSQ